MIIKLAHIKNSQIRDCIYLIILLSILPTSILNAQNTKVFRKKTLLGQKIYLLIPFDNKFILEKYDYWKSKYWLIKTDTIELQDDLYKKHFLNRNYDIVEYCDSSINTLRNNGHYDLVINELHSFSIKKIGYIYDAKHTELDGRFDVHVCFKDYEVLLKRYSEQYLDRINSISGTERKQ